MEKYSFHEISQLVKNGTLEEIAEISKEIGRDATVNNNKWTLLHIASFRNRPDVTQGLIEMGCNGNFLDKDGKSPLYYCKSEEVAKILISAGAKVNQPSILGKTPLHYACLSEADQAVVKVLLQSGAQVNVEDKFGNTPFLNACNMAYGCIDEEEFQAALPKLSILIEHGADVHHTNLKGESGLHICSLHRTYEIAEILLKHGVNVNAMTKKHQTPLIMACSHSSTALHGKEGVLATLDLLLKHGADPTIPDEQGLTPLHVLLLNHCSAMHMSATDIAPCVSILVESGASLNAADNMRRTPVHYACYAAARQPWPEMLELLMSLGADINAQDVEGFAPVHVTVPHNPGRFSSLFPWDCIGESEDMVKNINWNCARKHGVTVAHTVLAEKGLKLQGCEVPWDINATDEFKSSPMHYAEFSNNSTATTYLEVLCAQADITAKNCVGESPIDCAVSALNQEMLASLESYGGSSVLKELGLPDTSTCELCSHFANEGSCPKPFDNKEESVSVNPAEITINPVGTMEQYLSHILHTPRIGKVLETAEVVQIHRETENLILQILQRVANHDDRFQSILIQSGSVCEKTKAGLPDEFDFMCSLQRISSSCKVIDDGSCSPGFVRFKGIEGSAHMDEFLDAEGYLVPNLVRSKFEEIVRLVMFDPDLWKSCRICSNFILPGSNLGIAHPKPSVILELCWNGPVYKNMVYSIDLVPVIDAGVFWPVGAVVSCSPLLENIRKQCLFTMTIPRFERSVFGNEVRISFSLMESAIFCTIPEVIKDAYITAKAVREVCPTLVDIEETFSDEATYAAPSLIPSYWLKMALFHELEEHGLDDNCSLTVWVRRIYQRVHRYVFEEEVFPSFFMPRQDFIASKLKGRDKSFISLKALEKEFMACKKMCQIIQQFLSYDG